MGSKREREIREQLLCLLRKYDLGKWLFTREIRIEEGATPHSHPVLTLNTRHLGDDSLLLASFIHEQLHWHLLLCCLEYQALIELLGLEEAQRVLRCQNHYRWIYTTILQDQDRIGALLACYDLELL